MGLRKLVKANPWECSITAFAMATNQSVAELIKVVGHDGSRIINDLAEPLCRQGFHHMELVSAVYAQGWSCTSFARIVEVKRHNGNIEKFDMSQIFDNTIRTSIGVMMSTQHALAYNHGLLYDPDNGVTYEYSIPACKARQFIPLGILAIARRVMPTV